MGGIKDRYLKWKEDRDKELGYDCLVKLICDRCGKRWVEFVRQTIPPCPRCGSDEVYEYETLIVG
jgi:uncharacterized Zn ribbon protein